MLYDSTVWICLWSLLAFLSVSWTLFRVEICGICNALFVKLPGKGIEFLFGSMQFPSSCHKELFLSSFSGSIRGKSWGRMCSRIKSCLPMIKRFSTSEESKMGTLMVLPSKVRLHMAVPIYFMLVPLALEMLIFSQCILQPSFLASLGPQRERDAPESGHAINLTLLSPDLHAP